MTEDRILTVPQMIFCERKSAENGVSLAQLMDNAGEKLAEHILRVCRNRMSKKVVILVGKGNNGGDGLVAANLLCDSGILPTVVLCCGQPNTDLSKTAFERLHKNIPTVMFENNREDISLITQAEMLVDCIFGTGFKGQIRDNMRPLFKTVKDSQSYIIACDIPSGANAQSGEISEDTISADMTVTFHRRKIGMVLSPAKYRCGQIITEDIGIPNIVFDCNDEIMNCRIDDNISCNFFRSILPVRLQWGHKGTFGKIISVCGSESYIGAAGISTLAAMRTGVGLVNLCTTQGVISAVSARILECTYSPMKADSQGFMTEENSAEILKKLDTADCLLLGCGLGHTCETEKLVAELIEKSPCPIILDADGINSVCPNINILLKKKSTVILTPHPAELARLCGVSTKEVLSDRHKFASDIAGKYGVTVVSKGAETIICSGNVTKIISAGNTALSKGGSGDMLAGIIASFTAQNPLNTMENAMLGCYVMGSTAQMLSEKRSERGILATDIIEALPVFLKTLEDNSQE